MWNCCVEFSMGDFVLQIWVDELGFVVVDIGDMDGYHRIALYWIDKSLQRF